MQLLLMMMRRGSLSVAMINDTRPCFCVSDDILPVNSFSLSRLFIWPISHLLDITWTPFRDVNFSSIGTADDWHEEIINNNFLFIDDRHRRRMWNYPLFILAILHHVSWIGPVGTASVQYFPNIAVAFDNSNPEVFNGTLDHCLCHMTNDSQLVSLNYFSNNQTCQLHQQSDLSKSYRINRRPNVGFYAESLPLHNVSSKNSDSHVFDEPFTFSFSVRKKSHLFSISVSSLVIWFDIQWSIRKFRGNANWKPLLFKLDHKGIRVFSIVIIIVSARSES